MSGLKLTYLPDIGLTVVADPTKQVTFDLLNWELVVITPTAGRRVHTQGVMF